jgi:hypothetical protein
VASESGFYGRGADATAREKMFGTVERDWPWLRERMTDDCHLADSERELVAIFISLQFTRTRESFARREFLLRPSRRTARSALSRERPYIGTLLSDTWDFPLKTLRLRAPGR